MSANYIGGDESRASYAAIFVAGVLVGSLIRAGMWLLPSALVDAVVDRL
jgi:hypothetical protein